MKFILLAAMLWLSACSKQSFLDTIQLGLIPLAGQLPQAYSKDDTQAKLTYAIGGDSLVIYAERFPTAIDAYAQWLQENSLGQGNIVVGTRYRRNVCRGLWMFRLDLPQYQLPSDRAFDTLFNRFHGTQEGLSATFAGFPVRGRVGQGSAIRRGPFWGVDIGSPMFIQKYEDGIGSWNIAKSLQNVSDKQMQSLRGRFILEATGLENGCESYVYPGGRIAFLENDGILLSAWGHRSSQKLCSQLALIGR